MNTSCISKDNGCKDSVSCIILINKRNHSRPTIKPCWIPANHKLEFSFTVINTVGLISCSSITENTDYMPFIMCMHYITHKFICALMLVQHIFNFTIDNAVDPCYSLPIYNKYCLQKLHYTVWEKPSILEEPSASISSSRILGKKFLNFYHITQCRIPDDYYSWSLTWEPQFPHNLTHLSCPISYTWIWRLGIPSNQRTGTSNSQIPVTRMCSILY